MSFKKLLRSPIVDGQEGVQPRVNDIHRVRSAIRRRSQAWKGRRDHNQTTPISRLPREILLEVFLHLCTTFSVCTIRPGSWHWHKIAHICHDWREVAISSPVLWGYINLNSPKNFVHLLMARSRDAPLAIRCEVPDERDVDTLVGLIDRHRGRLRALDIHTPRSVGRLYDAFNRMGECSLVSLSASSQVGALDEEYSWLPDSPFVANRRQLSYLSLRACSFEWNSPIYSAHLTSLELIDIHTVLRPSAEQFLAIIANANKLENLALVHSAPVEFNSYPMRFRGMNIPSLKTFRLEDSEIGCAEVMLSLILPPTASFEITHRNGTTSTIESFYPIESLARSLPSVPPFTSARLVTERPGLRFQFTASRNRRVCLDFRDCGLWSYNCLKFYTLIAKTLRRFSTEHLTELVLCGLVSLTLDNHKKADLLECRKGWHTISGLVQLRVLKLITCWPTLLLETLFERAMLCIGVSMEATTTHIGTDGVGKQLLPKLARIELLNFNFCIKITEAKPLDVLVSLLWALQQHDDPVPVIHIPTTGTLESCTLRQLRRLTKVSQDGGEAWEIADGPQNHYAKAMTAFEQLVSLYQGPEIMDE